MSYSLIQSYCSCLDKEFSDKRHYRRGKQPQVPEVRLYWTRTEIVDIRYISDPSEILGAGALRAIWTGPFGLAIQTCEAQAVVVELAGAVIRAVILAKASLTVSSLVERSSGGIVT